jgi:hypothetical protein
MYPAINIYNKAPTKLDITVSLKPLPYQSDFFEFSLQRPQWIELVERISLLLGADAASQ